MFSAVTPPVPDARADLRVTRLRLPGRDGLHDLTIHDGLIASLEPSANGGGEPSACGRSAAGGTPCIDAAGLLVLPGLVESHTHLDKTLWGGAWYRNAVADRLQDRIDNERAFRAGGAHDAAAGSLALAQAFLLNGTTCIRSHVDIDTDIGLRHLDALLQTRRQMAPWQRIQIVAFAQSGVLGRPGTAELLEQAMARGADVVGGLDPCAIEGDPVRSLDLVFALAERHDKPIDIHLHESGEMGLFSLGLVLERVAAHGLQGRVAVSHAFCLGELAAAEQERWLQRLARHQVALITSAPAARPVPPLLAARRAGVQVAGGNDGIRDTWTPYGRPDMLERAMLIGLRHNLRRDDDIAQALDCVSHAGAAVCGFEAYGLQVGCRADLVLLDADNEAHAVCERPARQWVVSAGRVVVRAGKPVDWLSAPPAVAAGRDRG